MALFIFKNAAEYVGTCESNNDKIAAIEAIQAALLETAAKAAAGGDISQYSLNDGKTIISTTYRNVTDIQQSYMAFERLKNMLRQNNTGRMTRLVDKRTFNGSGWH